MALVFHPNIPQNSQELDADPVRNNFNALKELIDAGNAGGGGAPALKLDQRTPQTVIGYPVFDTGFYIGQQAMPWLWFDSITPQTLGDPQFQDPITVGEPVEDTHADTQGARNAAIAAALAFQPANPAYWTSPAPTTLAAAIDRLAARLSNNGAKPV